jgi:hypothetical protein
MNLQRLAPWAAAVIAAAFAMHNLNGAWIEPRYLGFASYADYADLEKLQAASRAWPWLLSGLGHVASGFAVVLLGLATWRRYGQRYPEAALVGGAAALLAGTGFLLVGTSHVIGRQTLFLLGDANPPALRDAAYTAATVVRIWVNALAQIGLGWFALQLAWCGRRSGELPRSFVWFSYVSGACGLLMAVAYIPIYLYTVLVWAAWLAVVWPRNLPLARE